MNAFGFDEQLAMSEGVCETGDIESMILGCIPGSVAVHRAHESNDRSGVDYWVEHERLRHLAVDVKCRDEDYATKGFDDLALEVASVMPENGRGGAIGWTLNTKKNCDYILWLWRDTGRFCIVPFHLLCKVFRKHKDAWCREYKTAIQTSRQGSRTWRSQCVFVPRREVWAAIYRTSGGVTDGTVTQH